MKHIRIKVKLSTQYGNKYWVTRIGEGESPEQAVDRVLNAAEQFQGKCVSLGFTEVSNSDSI